MFNQHSKSCTELTIANKTTTTTKRDEKDQTLTPAKKKNKKSGELTELQTPLNGFAMKPVTSSVIIQTQNVSPLRSYDKARTPQS